MADNAHPIRRRTSLLLCFCLALCASSPLFTGCAGHHTSPRTAERLDDKVIADNVQTALRAASAEAFAHVRVSVRDAVVTLRGSVPDAQAQARASQVAQGVEHVRQVDNQLQLRKLPTNQGIPQH